jgi:hypothetical protein
MQNFDTSDEILFDIHGAIQRRGYFVQYVVADRPDPPWAYTIGFLDHDHPEVIVLGLSPESSAGILRIVHEHVVAGDRLPVGREHGHDANGLPFALIRVDDRFVDESDYLLGCHHYYAKRNGNVPEVRAVQLVWADASGHLPWEDGFDASLLRFQPLLDEPVEQFD